MSKNESASKSKTAIWIAVVTGIFILCGTIIIVIGGPIIQQWLQSTPTPTQIAAAVTPDTPTATTPIPPTNTPTLTPTPTTPTLANTSTPTNTPTSTPTPTLSATPTPAPTPTLTSTPTPTATLEKAVEVHNQDRTGRISQDEIWAGTIHVTGDIWVDEGVTLTILPGTTVLIAANRDDQHRGRYCPDAPTDLGPVCTEEYEKSHIEIDGRIIAVGIPDEMIVFTSDSSTPNYCDWSGMHVRPGSRMEYCLVEYSGKGLGVWGTLPKDDSVLISNCIIRHVFWGGIALGGTTCARIISNSISDCGSEGIAVDPGAAPYIAYNTISNSTVGIATLPESFAVIENNTLIDNIKGIVSRANDTIRHNHISSPMRQIHEQSYMGYTFPYIAEPEVITFIGIVVADNPATVIEFNEILNNQTGIGIGPESNPSLTIINNNIYDNDYNIYSCAAVIVNAPNNWWGTTNASEIADKIHGKNDEPRLGEVIFEPFLGQPVENAGIVPSTSRVSDGE